MDPLTVPSLILGLALLALAYVALLRKPSHRKSPPSAGGAWPVLGHLPCLGGPKLPHVTFGEWADKYGPIFSIKLGFNHAVVISSAELMKECFTLNDMALVDRPKSTAAEIMGYNYFMFGLSPYGPYWRHVRKIATLELLSNHRISALNHVRESVVREFLRRLYDTWKDDECAVVDMKRWFNSVAYNVVLKMVVGKDYLGADEGGGEDGERCKRALSSMFVLLGAFVIGDAVPFLKWLDLGGYKKAMRETARELDALQEVWLNEHKEKRKDKGREVAAEDFMDVMLSIVDDGEASPTYDADIICKSTSLVSCYSLNRFSKLHVFVTTTHHQAQALILGGTDTTTVQLTWALALLLKHPEAMKKVQEELDLHVGRERPVSESDTKKLIYLQAVTKETLRLYPAAPVSVPRLSTRDITIGGYHVPAGTQIITNLMKLHRDPATWSDPEEFRPERFLTTHKDVDVRGQNFEFLPFGGGRRICPGISFAIQGSLLILASLLQGFDMRTPNGEGVDMTIGAGMTCPKVTPLNVVLTPRLVADNLYG
ncbi:hypothetical protein MLD38_022283 [Melastoma candidum]|uniref:Uncharacterized protein n=1 Tax=Melastoma candidum TaxID=119954 RepID=A0ACB9QKL3_9MYRT|nr:hypothetical protein MLD38_022283 [Melastoma candidum]